MTWLVRMLGIDRARAAFGRLARLVDAFSDDVEESLRKLRGRPAAPPAIEDKGRKAKAAATEA